MKKLMKNPLLTFILGVIISCSITSVLAYSILAPDVGFTPTDNAWKQDDGSDIENVKEAIDDLYERTKPNAELVYSFYPDSYNDSTMTKTVNLTSGTYLLEVTKANSEGFNSTMSVSVTNATIVDTPVDYHQFVGETNVNLYQALIKVEGNKEVSITMSQSIARGYSLKIINIYKIK
ncbi:MAG: hypothetical protein IJ572_00815 [Bacilli bacterium]|nr:hypothetical protein [Bacilli bacterium]